jgi:hypothetical protein
MGRQLDTLRAGGNCYGVVTVGRCGAYRTAHRGIPTGFASETRYFDKGGKLIAVRTDGDFFVTVPQLR